MRLIDKLHADTTSFHADADGDGLMLFGEPTALAYQAFLKRSYGFIAPIERAVVATEHIDHFLDSRRFKKHDLLRCDLEAMRMTRAEIEQLPQCAVPLFNSPEEALGWAYVIERGTLGNNNLFRHLARAIPGDVAYSAGYLKCYVGAVGEAWRDFAVALESVLHKPHVITSARVAFRTIRAWRRRLEGRSSAFDPGGHRFA